MSIFSIYDSDPKLRVGEMEGKSYPDLSCNSEILMNSSNSEYISNLFIIVENHANIERLIIHIRVV